MEVAKIFDKHALNYDNIDDLWYSWLFSRLHLIISKEVINRYHPEKILDIGCGTGFQSFLHAIGGGTVEGIDISEQNIFVAKKKCELFNKKNNISLFPSNFKFVDRYNLMISNYINAKSCENIYKTPTFRVADALNLPFEDNKFDHINCCGSTLSFIEDHQRALLEMRRVLKPNGMLFLEAESRWNWDLLWAFLDAILKGKLGYNSSFKKALKHIFKNPLKYMHYKYLLEENDQNQPLKLKSFTIKRLLKEFSNLNFKILHKWTIHSVTNIIPSTILERPKTSKIVKILFSIFSKIEETVPIKFPGCSIVLLACKTN